MSAPSKDVCKQHYSRGEVSLAQKIEIYHLRHKPSFEQVTTLLLEKSVYYTRKINLITVSRQRSKRKFFRSNVIIYIPFPHLAAHVCAFIYTAVKIITQSRYSGSFTQLH